MFDFIAITVALGVICIISLCLMNGLRDTHYPEFEPDLAIKEIMDADR